MHFQLLNNNINRLSQPWYFMYFLLKQRSKTTETSLAHVRTKNVATPSVKECEGQRCCRNKWDHLEHEISHVWRFSCNLAVLLFYLNSCGFPVLDVTFQDLGAHWIPGTDLWGIFPSWNRICQKMFVLWYLWNIDSLKGSRSVMPASVL